MSIAISSTLVFSFVVSIVSSWMVWNRKRDKRCVRFMAFIVNTIVLTTATLFLYSTDLQFFQKQMAGLFESLGITVLLFFIPIHTFLTIQLLEVLLIRPLDAGGK